MEDPSILFQESNLVTNALDMTINQRTVRTGGIVNAQSKAPFTFWAFTEEVRIAERVSYLGSVGDVLDNAVMESYWSSMRNELPNRKLWTASVEISNAMFDQIEVLHHRLCLHSQLGLTAPVEYM